MLRRRTPRAPDLHFAETLTAELPAPYRPREGLLLRNERVGTDRTGMHLVVDHMAQLQHVDHAHGSRLVELLARLAVVQVGATATRNAGLRRIFVDLVERGPVEDRRGELQPQLTAGPAEHGLVNLPEVHTRRHAQRVSTMSTIVPSSKNGMSSSRTTFATIPLLPWRPAILSPTRSLRFLAI